MLHTKCQAFEQSGSGEEDFLNIFLYFYMVQTNDPLGWDHFRPGDLHLNRLSQGLLENATYQNSSI